MSRLGSDDGKFNKKRNKEERRLKSDRCNSICVGFNFANQVMFIQIAMLLWALNFEKPLDANGDPIVPSRSDCIDAGVVVYVSFPSCVVKLLNIFTIVCLRPSNVRSPLAL
jgi:hypothetical protein